MSYLLLEVSSLDHLNTCIQKLVLFFIKWDLKALKEFQIQSQMCYSFSPIDERFINNLLVTEE